MRFVGVFVVALLWFAQAQTADVAALVSQFNQVETSSFPGLFKFEYRMEVIKSRELALSPVRIDQIRGLIYDPAVVTSYSMPAVKKYMDQKEYSADDVIGVGYFPQGLDHLHAFAFLKIADGGAKVHWFFTGDGHRDKGLMDMLPLWIQQNFGITDITFVGDNEINNGWVVNLFNGLNGRKENYVALSPFSYQFISDIKSKAARIFPALRFPAEDFKFNQEQDARPFCMVTAGLPGAGKSKVVQSLKELGLLGNGNTVEVDLDEFAREEMLALESFEEEAVEAIYARAWAKLVLKREELLAQGKNIIVQTTSQNPRTLMGWMDAAAKFHPAIPYRFLLLYVTADAKTASHRAQMRSAEDSGRAPVPEKYALSCQKNVAAFEGKVEREFGGRVVMISNTDVPRLESLAFYPGNFVTDLEEMQWWKEKITEPTVWMPSEAGRGVELANFKSEPEYETYRHLWWWLLYGPAQ